MFQKLKQVTLRPKQQQAIDFFKQSNKRFVIMELPVGEGKTIMSMQIAELLLTNQINIENNSK